MGFLNAVKPFKLTKAECMNLINDPPSTPLHIQLQIEDSEERLTEEAVNQIIELSKEWLIPQPEASWNPKISSGEWIRPEHFVFHTTMFIFLRTLFIQLKI